MTQIIMTFRFASVYDPRPKIDEILPEPDEEVFTSLFSASAIVRRGQWGQSGGQTGLDSSQGSAELDRAEQKWARMARQRQKKARCSL
jgi:hypothetical protein